PRWTRRARRRLRPLGGLKRDCESPRHFHSFKSQDSFHRNPASQHDVLKIARLLADATPTIAADKLYTLAAATCRLSAIKHPSLPASLGAPELEVEAPELKLLIRVGREFDVLLQAVILVGLDDWQPREVLQEDLRHLTIGVGAEPLVDGEAGRVAQLVELGVAPVVVDASRTEQAPHHPVGIAERRGRIAPPQALETLLAALLGPDRVLDHFDFHVDAHVLPHGRDG